LGREFPGLLMGGKEVQPGVWIARNVSVHPTAKLKSPAYLGENSRVGAMVQVGPAASIGRDCMIERETFVCDSVVFGGSYVGQQLALRGVVVDRSRLINTRWGAEIEGVDELLLGSVFGAPIRTGLQRGVARVVAALGLILALPFLSIMLLLSLLGLIPALTAAELVRTPAVSEAYRWKYFLRWSFGDHRFPEGGQGWIRNFFFCFLPALFTIAAGHMDFAGSRPRTKEEAEQATINQRSAFLRSRPGFLHPELFGSPAVETGWNCHRETEIGWRETLGLLLRYFGRLLRNFLIGLRILGEWRPAE
jgi:hypothetical protein